MIPRARANVSHPAVLGWLLWRKKSSASGPSKPPDNIYILLLAWLFQERRTFLIGALIMSGAMALTFWETGEPLLVFTSTLFVAVAVARLLFMYAYQRAAPQTQNAGPGAEVGVRLRRGRVRRGSADGSLEFHRVCPIE
jgi:hypothetical protein